MRTMTIPMPRQALAPTWSSLVARTKRAVAAPGARDEGVLTDLRGEAGAVGHRHSAETARS